MNFLVETPLLDHCTDCVYTTDPLYPPLFEYARLMNCMPVTMVTDVGHFKLVSVINVSDHVLITVPGDHSTEDVTSCTCTRRLGEE